MRDPFVAAVQEKLLAHGFDPGPIDGDAGPKTRAAIAAFQRDRALPPTETVTAATWAALDSDSMPERDRDPPVAEPRHVAPVWPRQADCMSFYGGVGLNQSLLTLPYPMKLAWDTKVTIERISVHRKVHDSARRCFEAIAEAYSPEERADLGIDLFGGSLNVRKMRGGSRYSMHSWGIAIDFDPIRNQLSWGRDRARLAQPDAERFWDIWEEEGWVSLGRTRNFDWMHVQAARL